MWQIGEIEMEHLAKSRLALNVFCSEGQPQSSKPPALAYQMLEEA